MDVVTLQQVRCRTDRLPWINIHYRASAVWMNSSKMEMRKPVKKPNSPIRISSKVFESASWIRRERKRTLAGQNTSVEILRYISKCCLGYHIWSLSLRWFLGRQWYTRIFEGRADRNSCTKKRLVRFLGKVIRFRLYSMVQLEGQFILISSVQSNVTFLSLIKCRPPGNLMSFCEVTKHSPPSRLHPLSPVTPQSAILWSAAGEDCPPPREIRRN